MTRAKGRRAMTNPVNSSVENEDAPESTTDEGKREFFNVFDGTKGRSEGSYLDIQERISAEKIRAIQEAREADLSEPGKLPAATGTPLVPKERQVDNSLYSNPSIEFTGHKEVEPVVTLNVDAGEATSDVDLSYAAQVARERKAQDEALESAATGSLSEPENTAGSDFTERTLEESGPATDETQNADFNTLNTNV